MDIGDDCKKFPLAARLLLELVGAIERHLVERDRVPYPCCGPAASVFRISRSGPEIGAAEGELRVPVVEEELVVEKRPVVKEELVISKEQVHESRPVDVEVRKEQFDIQDDRSTAVRDVASGERTAPKGDR